MTDSGVYQPFIFAICCCLHCICTLKTVFCKKHWCRCL